MGKQEEFKAQGLRQAGRQAQASVEAVPVALFRVVLQLGAHTLDTIQEHGCTMVPVCKAGATS